MYTATINFHVHTCTCTCTLYMCKITCTYVHVYTYMYMKNQVGSAKKRYKPNPGQLFWAFGPHQQGAAQSLPGTAAGLKRTCTCMYTYMYVYCLPQLYTCSLKPCFVLRIINPFIYDMYKTSVHVYTLYIQNERPKLYGKVGEVFFSLLSQNTCKSLSLFYPDAIHVHNIIMYVF